MFFCARLTGTVLKALLTEKGFFFEKQEKLRIKQKRK